MQNNSDIFIFRDSEVCLILVLPWIPFWYTLTASWNLQEMNPPPMLVNGGRDTVPKFGVSRR